MNSIRRFRFAMIALIPVAAISFGIGAAPAQTVPPQSSGTPATPAPVESNTPPPVTTTTPAPAPAPSAVPAPPPAEDKSPADSPAAAQTPAAPAAILDAVRTIIAINARASRLLRVKNKYGIKIYLEIRIGATGRIY